MKIFPEIDVEGLIKRIPRPERSGCISVAISLLSLWTILHPDFGGLDCGFLSLHSCPVAAEEITPDEERKAVPLYFGSGPEEAKELCHLDVKTKPPMPGLPNLIHTDWYEPHDSIDRFTPGSETEWYTQLPMTCPAYPGVSVECSELVINGNLGAKNILKVPYGYIPSIRWHCPKRSNQRGISSRSAISGEAVDHNP